MIIDAHTHGFPPQLGRQARAWAISREEHYWADLVAPLEGDRSIQGWADCDDFLRAMDEAGVDRVVLQGWYWEHQTTCDEQNNWHLQWQQAHPDRFITFASVQPLAGVTALNALRQAVDRGALGIGEILPQVQGFGRDHPGWLEILQFAQDSGLPVTLHVTEPVGHDYRGRVETPLTDYIWYARQFPDLKLILAHWGGGLPFFELNPKVKGILRNVYYDTAASPLLYEPSIWSQVLDVIGPERILFASDYPLRIYPASSKSPEFKLLRKEMESVVTDPLVRKKILGGNFESLLL